MVWVISIQGYMLLASHSLGEKQATQPLLWSFKAVLLFDI